MNTSRVPRGVPSGGQFSENAHDEAAPMKPVETNYGSGIDETIAALNEFSRIVEEAEAKSRARKKEKALERRRALYRAKKMSGTLPKRKTKKQIEDERIHDRADAAFHQQTHGESDYFLRPM